MRIDLHNHTIRCNHATGTVDEYIARAIDLGIDIYGFSEHAPMDFDEHYRLKFDEMRLYEQEIREAKRKYAKYIKIVLGYEVDYLPDYIDDRVVRADVDYLIGSVHFIDQWGFDNPEFIGEYESRDIDAIWRDYFLAIEEMATSGLFDIVGHLDLIKLFRYMPQTDIRLLAKDALHAIKKSNMVLEINAAGLRKPIKEIYPSYPLLQEAYSLDIPITLGSDAHALNQVGLGYEQVVAVAKEIGYSQIVTFEKREKQLVSF